MLNSNVKPLTDLYNGKASRFKKNLKGGWNASHLLDAASRARTFSNTPSIRVVLQESS